MKLDQVQITQFRNISSAHIIPSPHLNVVVGQNGSGKSSFLESLHYLGFGRSFRTSKHKSVIQEAHNQFSVFALCTDTEGEKHKIGFLRNSSDEFQCSINGEKSQRLADLVAHIPVQIFTPQSSDLLLGAPNLRRRFIDWGLFHVEQSYYSLSMSYSKILKQRNALLKLAQKSPNFDISQIVYWSHQLAIYGEKVSKHRVNYISALKLIFNRISLQFLPEFSLEISYNQGWDNSLSLVDALDKKLSTDIKMGFTSIGVHKADLKLMANGVNAIERLSRGQLRMLVAALQLSQTLYLTETTKKSGVFLLDDIGAELDLQKREAFIMSCLKPILNCLLQQSKKANFLLLKNIMIKKCFT